MMDVDYYVCTIKKNTITPVSRVNYYNIAQTFRLVLCMGLFIPPWFSELENVVVDSF